MIKRAGYLDKLVQSRDKQVIKAVTGVRRCGKSTLLGQFQDVLRGDGVMDGQIVSLDFERPEMEPLLDAQALYEYVRERLSKDRMTYIFLDEVQLVPGFQRVVESLFAIGSTDLYIAGSNRCLLPDKISSPLYGKYVEIPMLPFSFAEYYEFAGGDRRDAWDTYFLNGGFPYAARIGDGDENGDVRRDYLLGIYHAILLRDLVGDRHIQDVALLQDVMRSLSVGVGNVTSPKKVSDGIVSSGRKTTSATVEHYIRAFQESYIVYKARRYDVRGRQRLKSLEKYYLADVGLWRLLAGNQSPDYGCVLENIVYLELLRRGYRVSVGKIGSLGVDFVAEGGGDRIYYQVAASVLDPTTFAREVTPLKKVNDHFPKFIITMDEISLGVDGIRQINAVDFLLGGKGLPGNRKFQRDA